MTLSLSDFHGVTVHDGHNDVPWLLQRVAQIAHPTINSWGLRDRYASLHGGPGFDPVEPLLEARELIKTFDASKLVTPNPTTLL